MEKNSPYGYLFVSDRDWKLYQLYRDGAAPQILLDMPEVEKMSGGNLYRILNRVDWIMRHRPTHGYAYRYDSEKRHGLLFEVKAHKNTLPKTFFQEASIPVYLKDQLEHYKP